MASGSSQNLRNEREKACWTAERHKAFVELCVEEVTKHNRVNQSFNRQGWKNIVDGFFMREGVHYDQKQMKNHYNSVRDSWKAWHKLVDQTGVTIDPMTGGVLCDDQTWTTFIQANPECKDFRKHPLSFVNQLDLIYEGTIATGEHSWAPSEGYHPAFDFDVEAGEGDAYFANTNPETSESGRIDITREYASDESEGNQNKQSEARIRRRSDGSTTSKKRRKEGESDRQWSELCEAIRCSGSMSFAPPPPPPPPLIEEKFTLPECITVLNNMSDQIPIGGLLYMKATTFFRDKLNRETWMSFPTNEVRAQWLQYMIHEAFHN